MTRLQVIFGLGTTLYVIVHDVPPPGLRLVSVPGVGATMQDMDLANLDATVNGTTRFVGFVRLARFAYIVSS